MKYLILRTKANLAPGTAMRAAQEVQAVAEKTGIIILDNKFEYPPAVFEADSLQKESGLVTTRKNGYVKITASPNGATYSISEEPFKTEQENAFLRKNRDSLRNAVKNGLHEFERLKKEYDELTKTAIKYMEENEKLKNEYFEVETENKNLHYKENERKKKTIKKVEQALGITLYQWQQLYILNGEPYGEIVCNERRNGKTLAHILRLCLSDGEPIIEMLNPACVAQNEFLKYLGEDGCTIARTKFFISELKNIYCALKRVGGIGLREIIF